MVVSLTGAAGRFGQAASKSVELAFSELNKAAGAGGIAGCKLAFDLRDAQSQGTVAVDQARQLVDLKKVPAIIGGIISSVSIPVVTSVTGPAGVVQISPASTSPTLTKLGNEGKTGGWFFRTITSDALQGTAAAKYAIDNDMKTLAIIHVNNDFGVNMLAEFRRAFEALGGKVTSVTPYNAQQPSYAAEVTNALKGDPPALYFIGYPGDGTTIVRTWIQQGGPQRFLLNDGMNAADFIKGVGPAVPRQRVRHVVGHDQDAVDRVLHAGLSRDERRLRCRRAGGRPRVRRRIDPRPGHRARRQVRGGGDPRLDPQGHRAGRRGGARRPAGLCARAAAHQGQEAGALRRRDRRRCSSTRTATSSARSAPGASPTARSRRSGQMSMEDVQAVQAKLPK